MKRLTRIGALIPQYIARWAPVVIILAALPAVCSAQQKRRASPLRIVQLPSPSQEGSVSLEQTLAKRRSVRQFTGRQLTFEQIGQLAWAGQGITEPEKGYRTAPSAGALYPITLYFATPEGLFVYHPDGHTLEENISNDIRSKLSMAAFKQQAVADAACDIIVAGSAKKLAAKYRSNARRYLLLEAGHIAQNIHLQAVGLGFGSGAVGAFDIRDVGKICRLSTELEPIYIICVGYPAEQVVTKKIEEGKKEEDVHKMDSAGTKKAVLIIASENFRDEELFETQKALNNAAVETIIASTKTGVIKGMLAGRAEAAILVNDIVVDDYDAIVFIGSSGAREYFDSQVALNIARQAKSKQKVLAAICIAPAVLANAGVLDGVRAKSFSSERMKLKKGGAEYAGADVEQDDLIITGSGPKAASQFGKIVAEALLKK